MKFLSKLLVSAALIAATSVTYARCEQFYANAKPVTSTIEVDQLCYSRMAILFSRAAKSPLVVAERLTILNVQSDFRVARRNNFRQDPSIPTSAQPSAKDFVNNEWDQGHMAPFEDFADSVNGADESFFYTNIVAQQEKNNRGIWRALEMRTRKSAVSYGEIYVLTGPAFVEQNYLPSGVKIPTHLWKVVLVPKTNEAFVFIIPNKSGYAASDIPTFNATFDQLKQYVPYLDFGDTSKWTLKKF